MVDRKVHISQHVSLVTLHSAASRTSSISDASFKLVQSVQKISSGTSSDPCYTFLLSKAKRL